MHHHQYLFKVPSYQRIAGLFPQHEITLLYGSYGTGKSYSTIKALNEAKIKPLYINLDHTAGLEGLSFENLSEGLLEHYKDITSITSEDVVIIDTYTQFVNTFAPSHSPRDIYNLIKDIQQSFNQCTLIVIGHSEDLATRNDLFKDNPMLIRNAAEALLLEKILYRATKTRSDYIEYKLRVLKGRGYKGPRIIQNWMRS
jgi:archaellum biogenesis ATPase FlaH